MIMLDYKRSNAEVLRSKVGSYRDLSEDSIKSFVEYAIDCGLEMGYSFNFIADIMNVDRKTLYRWYHGENIPDFAACCMLDLAFCGGKGL